MGNCSNISNTQSVSLTAGTITSGFCHTSLQTTYEEFIARTTASLSGNLAGFVAGDDTPSASDQDKLWYRQNASNCNDHLGWHFYNTTSSAWEAVKTPVSSLADNTQGDIIYYGASGAPAVLNAGTDGHYLKTKGSGQNPEWAAVPQIGFASNQGTPTTNTLGASYTHWGTCTLTLPEGKTWLWVKVVVAFKSQSGRIVEQGDFKITTDSDGTDLMDTSQSSAGWVCVDSRVQGGNSDDNNTCTRIAEGAPISIDGTSDHTSDTSLDLKVYMVGGGGGDETSYRTLYAVGQYA